MSTRNVFGLNIGDTVCTLNSSGALGLAPATTAVTGWSAQTGGTQITDLEDMSNNPTATVSPNANGNFVFQGPDPAGAFGAWANGMWADAGNGYRVWITPIQLDNVYAPKSLVTTLPATYVPWWQPNTSYTAGQITIDMVDGHTIQRIANGTSRATYDATEQAAWNVIGGGGGGTVQALTRTAVKTANYTASLWDLIPCDTSGGSFTVTLPAASGGKGRIAIKLVTAGNTLNLALTGSDHFNTSSGTTTGMITLSNQGIVVESDGSGIWTVTADDLPLSQLDNRYSGTIWRPDGFGTCPGDATDVTSYVNSAIAASQAFGGTVELVPGKLYTCLGALTPTYTGTTTPTQKPVRITTRGAASSNGMWPSNALNGGATLDLRYAGAGGTSPAKIDTRGAGRMEIDHINLISGGTDNYPFVQTTNTRVDIHDCFVQGNTANSGSACLQDAFILGGTSTTLGNGANAPFQGYGSSIRDNHFDHIRRGVVGQTYCNSIPVERNTFSTTCGNAGTGGGNYGGAIEFIGISGSACTGNSTRGNTIESTHYLYGVALVYAVQNNIGPDGYWDGSSPFVAGVYVDTTAQYNMVITGAQNDSFPAVADAGRTTTVITAHQSIPSQWPQPHRFTSPIPNVAINSSSAAIWATSPNGSMAAVVAHNGNFPYTEVDLTTQPAISVSDGVTTSGSPVITSATAAWAALDVGMPITGAGIPANTVILSRQSATQVTLSANATATATGVSFFFGRGSGAGQTDEVGFSRRHQITKGAIGTATIQAAAGTGATCSVTGTDGAFTVTINTGTGPTSGDLVVVGQGINWAAAPKVIVTPKNAAAGVAWATGQMYSHNTTSNTYLSCNVAVAASTTLIFDVIQMQ